MTQDDDCEDQGMWPTAECVMWACNEWDGERMVRPRLVLRGKHWVCPRCGASYGEEAHGEHVAE